MPFTEIQLNTTFEAVAARINNHLPITLCNIYLPNSKLFSQQDLEQIINQLPPPFILLGDFNSHNPIWGSTNTDSTGKIVEDLINSNDDLIILNNGTNTHFNVNTGYGSAINITIASREIATFFDWMIMEELYNSDHNPIMITDTRYSNYNMQESYHPKCLLNRANWGDFQHNISAHLNELPKPNTFKTTPINIILNNFTRLITNAAIHSIPRSANCKFKKAVPWWNINCKNAINATKKAYRKLKKNITEENKVNFKRIRAISRRIVKQSKREQWEEFTASIAPTTPMAQIWNKVRRINGNYPTFSTPLIPGTDGNVLPDSLQTADHLTETFASNSNDFNYTNEFKKFRDQTKSIPVNLNCNLDPIIKPFSLNEIHLAISRSKNTSPGPDDIPNIMIKNSPKDCIEYLLTLYNHIWINQTLPDQWKEATVIPIPKPNKDHTKSTNYRPISLTCNLSKILEKMVCKRLRWKLEIEKFISPTQYGSRNMRSTTDYLINLEAYICDALAINDHRLGIQR